MSTDMMPVAPVVRVAPIDETPSEQHPAAVYLARLGATSRRSMLGALNVIADILRNGATAFDVPWQDLRYQHTQAVRAALAERYSPASANHHLAALRGVLQESWRLGYVTAEVYQRSADLEPVRGHRLPAGRAINRPELTELFDVCGRNPTGVRNRALLAVLYGCGLRRSEIVGVDLDHFDATTGAIRVVGKGHKERMVYAANSGDVLRAWLDIRGREPGPLFTRIRRGGNVTMKRMTDQAILFVLQELAITAGVAHLTPHDMRRSFVGDLLDAGADLATVQALAGHASPSTTAKYDRRGEAAKLKVSRLLLIPK